MTWPYMLQLHAKKSSNATTDASHLTLSVNHSKQLTYHRQNGKANLSQKSPVLIPGKKWVLEGFTSCMSLGGVISKKTLQ